MTEAKSLDLSPSVTTAPVQGHRRGPHECGPPWHKKSLKGNQASHHRSKGGEQRPRRKLRKVRGMIDGRTGRLPVDVGPRVRNNA